MFEFLISGTFFSLGGIKFSLAIRLAFTWIQIRKKLSIKVGRLHPLVSLAIGPFMTLFTIVGIPCNIISKSQPQIVSCWTMSYIFGDGDWGREGHCRYKRDSCIGVSVKAGNSPRFAWLRSPSSALAHLRTWCPVDERRSWKSC
jgi:hypothetical protein